MFTHFLFPDEDLFSLACINSSEHFQALVRQGSVLTPTGCYRSCLFLASPLALLVNAGGDKGARLGAGVFGSRVPESPQRGKKADSQLCGPLPPHPTSLHVITKFLLRLRDMNEISLRSLYVIRILENN